MRWWRRKINRVPTLRGHPSVLDDVLAAGPPVDPVSAKPNLELYALQQEAAAHADMARDLSDAFDDLEAAERRRRDALTSGELRSSDDDTSPEVGDDR